MGSGNDKINLFIEDAKEQVDEVARNLLLLEQADGPDLLLVNEVFRGIHTIKGGADFLGLEQIKELSHSVEDVLDLVRNQKVTLTQDGIGTLLVATDYLKEMLNDPDNSRSIEISGLIEDIIKLSEQPGAEVVESENGEIEQIAFGPPSAPELFSIPARDNENYSQQQNNLFILELNNSDDPQETEFRESSLKAVKGIAYILDSQVSEDESILYVLFRTVLSRTLTVGYLEISPSSLFSCGDNASVTREDDVVEIPRARSDGELWDTGESSAVPDNMYTEAIASSEINMEKSSQPETQEINESTTGTENQAKADDTSLAAQSIRVNVDILDNLMNLAGELVLTRNQLNQNVSVWDKNAIDLAAQRLDTVTSELQGSIMSTRMQPIGIVFKKFHRVIRDMSQQLGKSIDLHVEGEDVELDKSIIENINDPLIHLVRNAVDHGIETSSDRLLKNKPQTGSLSIKAKHEAGHVVIEIADDGSGIDTEKVKEKALEKGIIDRVDANEISEKELQKLIFAPGFTTSEIVSDISGRGVGMDVVFTNISRLGGTIDIDTEMNVGTTFRIKLPLTLAIVPCLLVTAASDSFAIPQVNLVELVRIPPDETESRIEYVGDSAVVRLRGDLLPIVWLDKFLGMEETHVDVSQSQGTQAQGGGGATMTVDGNTALQLKDRSEEDSINIAVVAAGDFRYGIVVDHLTDSEEIVVKPLGSHLRGSREYAGATVLGDGRAALILDILSIAETVVTEANRNNSETEQETMLKKAQESAGDEESLLIVENGEDEYFGIPLAYVNRIERIPEDSIEQTGNKQVIKYRGGILRLFQMEDAIDVKARSSRTHVYLIIFHMMGMEVAIVVSSIIDIVYTGDKEIDKETLQRPGVTGSVVVMDKITLLLDVFELVKVIDPNMSATKEEGKTVGGQHMPSRRTEDGESPYTVLVVEDSVFFRDKIKELLEGLRYNVLLAEDGQLGWETLLANEEEIDLVLMDIEMPNMTGLELSRKIREESRFNDLPIVMLTSLAKESDVEEGKKAGASEYLIKMDQEMVKNIIAQYLS